MLDHGVAAAALEEPIPILVKACADVSSRGGYSGDQPMFILYGNQTRPALLELLLKAGAIT